MIMIAVKKLESSDCIEGIKVYLSTDDIANHEKDIIHINKEISERLKNTSFSYLDFCDVSAGAIQVRLFHKEISGYCYIYTNLKYDWSNIEEVINDAVNEFKRCDTSEHLKSYKKFIADGEKYGWD